MEDASDRICVFCALSFLVIEESIKIFERFSSCKGPIGIACSLTRSLILNSESFLLLIFQDICDQCFQLCTILRLFSVSVMGDKAFFAQN